MIRPDLWKPWYVYRPLQAVRRARYALRTHSSEYRALQTAWGVQMLAIEDEHIGQSLATIGVYDLAVSEVIFRLAREGDLVMDAGANIGYMTLLAAVAVGPRGRVVAFEPNPEVFEILRENVVRASARFRTAPVELRRVALGARSGSARLMRPSPAERNNGLAFIADPAAHTGGRHVAAVDVETLDTELRDRTVGLLKIDVEGYERPVLEGAARALSSRRVRDIVFEDHEGPNSAAASLLLSFGYTLFCIGWSMRRPILAAPDRASSTYSGYEAPSYLATLEPERAVRSCASAGWRALRRQARRLT